MAIAIAIATLCYCGVMLLLLVFSLGVRGSVHVTPNLPYGSVSISEEGYIINCMIDYDPAFNSMENRNIEVYLDYYEPDVEGAGCLYWFSETDELTIDKYLMLPDLFHRDIRYSFQKEGEKLLIDGVTLEKNESWESVKTASLWNPWMLTKGKISLVNYGIITGVKDSEGNITPYGPTLVIIGSMGTYDEANYAGIGLLVPLLIISVGYLVYSYIHTRTLRKTQ